MIAAAFFLSNITSLYVGYNAGEVKDKGVLTLRNEQGKVVAQGKKEVSIYILKTPYRETEAAAKAAAWKMMVDSATKIAK